MHVHVLVEARQPGKHLECALLRVQLPHQFPDVPHPLGPVMQVGAVAGHRGAVGHAHLEGVLQRPHAAAEDVELHAVLQLEPQPIQSVRSAACQRPSASRCPGTCLPAALLAFTQLACRSALNRLVRPDVAEQHHQQGLVHQHAEVRHADLAGAAAARRQARAQREGHLLPRAPAGRQLRPLRQAQQQRLEDAEEVPRAPERQRRGLGAAHVEAVHGEAHAASGPCFLARHLGRHDVDGGIAHNAADPPEQQHRP
mmetsp:Transcript_11968/g.37439  ORF Transcript_11968/g.37439 Transcript_11968/m.37439 type:complete len:255 (+) Transcript_11968:620-1384(+)